MDPREEFRRIRTKVKELAAEQILLKRARKTKDPEAAKLRERFGLKLTWPSAAWRVLERRIIITAHLNRMHELRGSEYRHGIREGMKYLYDKIWKELHDVVPQKA